MDINQLVESIQDQIYDALKLGPINAIGIDIGLSSIKMAELQHFKNQTFKLVSYVEQPLPEASLIDDDVHKENEVVDALKKAFQKLNPTHKICAFGFFGPNTVVKRLQLPGGTPEEVADQVEWEVEQYIPFPLEESNISHHLLGNNLGGGVDVQIAAVKKSTYNSFKKLLEASGAKLKIADVEAVAFTNLFMHTLSEKSVEEGGTYILLNLGSQKSTLIIYKEGAIVFSKEISIAGLSVTEEIQRQMGVSFQEAESLKIEGDGEGNLPEEIETIIRDVITALLEEIKKSIDFYITSTQDSTFSGCYIGGGTAQLAGFQDALQELLGINVAPILPFQKIQFDGKKFTNEKIEEISVTGLVALGLAMRRLRA